MGAEQAPRGELGCAVALGQLDTLATSARQDEAQGAPEDELQAPDAAGDDLGESHRLESDDREAAPDVSTEIVAAEEVAAEQVTAVLTGVLDRLGAAHHRPFSRS